MHWKKPKQCEWGFYQLFDQVLPLDRTRLARTLEKRMKPTPIRLLSRKFGCHALVVVFLACLLPLVVLSEERVGWKTSRIHGTPDPELPFQVKKRFPKLRFKEPVDLEQIPGTERLAILELSGKLSSFANNDQASVGSALELKKQSFGIAFHPQFEKNHLLFISYVLKDGDTNGTHLSQFTASSVDPLVVDPKSEKLILTWPGGGHNGGSLQFGNEGFLYISTGDGANPNPPDPYNTGQDLRDLLGSILRIDVDHPSNGSAYGIPSDNPFIKTTGARPEIWAFGLRNPWRMSFDKPTGNLWVGDVGWELWEMIYKVERGGNYGWSIMEGPQHLRNDLKEGPAPVSPPVISHPHTEGASITGGYVYHGKKLSTLNNLYIYGDWISGRIWSLQYESGKMVSHSQIATTPLNIICFGQDKNGELLVVDYGGEIYELEPNPAFGKPSRFPVKLSDTGLFISTKTLTSSPGVYSYSVQAEMWMDNSTAQRWIAIPEAGSVSKNNEGKWIYPPETVFVRTVFSTNQTHSEKGDKRIETQLLHLSGTQWKGYSYRWNDAQDDADLIPAEGIEQEADPSKENHSSLNNWHFSSRAECMRCHSYSFSPVLGFSAIQLSGRNELARLKEVKILPPELVPDSGARLVNPYQSELNLNARARSWLHVNCGHCHREGAGGSVPAHFNFELKRDEMKSVDVKPTQGNFDLPDARIIAPGAPNHSALIYRISSLGPSHMPRVGPTTLDTRGLNLIWDWILAGADDKNSAEDNSHKT
ncbi:MAG: hypothetical protein JWM04_1379, partial [Verrucomicrobiales bacterium]|nr:hypothetical protein [Verrucomicrobiales bacterium]